MAREEQSVVSSSTVIRGNVSGQGSLLIEGQIRGDVVVTGDVVLGQRAAVQGSISGASISVAGSVQGDINGSEAVMLDASARVVGDLKAPRIGVAQGALVRGAVHSEGAPAGATPVARPAIRRSVPERVVRTPRAVPEEMPAAETKPAAAQRVAEEKKAPPPPPPRAETVKAAPVKKAARKKAPAPVVAAPKRGVRGRKKTSKR